jgi:hypothetical protein
VKPTKSIADDGSGHLAGKPIPPFNTPAPSEADYSKYQRTNTPSTPETRTLPKPKPPVTRNRGSHRYGNNGNNNATTTTDSNSKETDSSPPASSSSATNFVKHKHGNDILTVEIDRKEKRRSTVDGGDGGKMLRRRSLKNSLSATSGSSQEGGRRGSQENDVPTFSGHSRR